MINLRFQCQFDEDESPTEYLAERVDGLALNTKEKLDKRSISSPRRAGRRLRAPLAANLLIIIPVLSLCGALAGYCFANARLFAGAWAASACLAWVFLLGADAATVQPSFDQDRDGETPSISSRGAEFVPPRGAARELCSKALVLVTGDRASVATNSGFGAPSPTESIPSMHSLRPTITRTPGKVRQWKAQLIGQSITAFRSRSLKQEGRVGL